MRSRASTAQRAMAISATTTVIGLLRAARTRRMGLPPGLGNKRMNIAGGGGHAQQSAPDGEAGQRVVDLGLGEQALRLGDFGNGSQARFVPRRRLLGGGERRRSLDWGVAGDAPCAVE